MTVTVPARDPGVRISRHPHAFVRASLFSLMANTVDFGVIDQ